MKNIKTLGIIAMVAVIGFGVAACEGIDEEEPPDNKPPAGATIVGTWFSDFSGVNRGGLTIIRADGSYEWLHCDGVTKKKGTYTTSAEADDKGDYTLTVTYDDGTTGNFVYNLRSVNNIYLGVSGSLGGANRFDDYPAGQYGGVLAGTWITTNATTGTTTKLTLKDDGGYVSQSGSSSPRTGVYYTRNNGARFSMANLRNANDPSSTVDTSAMEITMSDDGNSFSFTGNNGDTRTYTKEGTGEPEEKGIAGTTWKLEQELYGADYTTIYTFKADGAFENSISWVMGDDSGGFSSSGTYTVNNDKLTMWIDGTTPTSYTIEDDVLTLLGFQKYARDAEVPGEGLIGRWDYDSGDGYYIEFKADGTYESKLTATPAVRGTFTYTDDTLTRNPASEYTFSISGDGNTLTWTQILTDGTENAEQVFTREAE